MRQRRTGAQQRAPSHTSIRRAPLAVALAALLTLALAPGAAEAKPIAKPTWVKGVLITEYFPTLEKWFVGRKVAAPGLSGQFRVDWLYSARGVTMEGDGIGLDGRNYHVSAVGNGGWVDRFGRPSSIGAPIFWRAGGYWLNAERKLTYPLEIGGWSNGVGRRYVPLGNVRFATGLSLPLKPYKSLAVDPRLIPLGSRVYLPAYRATPGGGWFVAQDTGGAIRGRHIDVFRPPPASLNGSATHTGERIYVIPPGRRASTSAPQRATSTSPSGGTTAG